MATTSGKGYYNRGEFASIIVPLASGKQSAPEQAYVHMCGGDEGEGGHSATTYGGMMDDS